MKYAQLPLQDCHALIKAKLTLLLSHMDDKQKFDLAPAVAFDENASLEDVRRKLMSGQCEAAMVGDFGLEGIIVTEISNRATNTK